MESHNQDEPLKTIMEWLSKRALFDEVMDFLDDDSSNDEIEKGILENNKLNDTLKSALKKRSFFYWWMYKSNRFSW